MEATKAATQALDGSSDYGTVHRAIARQIGMAILSGELRPMDKVGGFVAIESERARIVGVAEEHRTVRPGCVSMPHSWGRHPRHEQRPRIDRANSGCLVSIDRDCKELAGQPLVSGIPVSVSLT